MHSTANLRIRPHLGEDIAIGPGKIDLLEAIQRRGSISGAARELGMSHRHSWLQVETMNRSFREPLVISLVGGRHGGGARLSNTGGVGSARHLHGPRHPLSPPTCNLPRKRFTSSSRLNTGQSLRPVAEGQRLTIRLRGETIHLMPIEGSL